MEPSKCGSTFRALIDDDLCESDLAHVRTCESCREVAESIVELRVSAAMNEADSAPLSEPEATAILNRVWSRQEARKRRQIWLGTAAAAAIVLLSLFLFDSWSTSDERPALGPQDDPVAYAHYLNQIVFGASGSADTDYEVLKRDHTLRGEFESALRHDSSLVRRTAYDALAQSGVPIDSEITLGLLAQGFDEDFHASLEVAADQDIGRYMLAQLQRRRTATLQIVLAGLAAQVSDDPQAVGCELLAKYLDEDDPYVRNRALTAMGFASDFRHREQVQLLMKHDSDPNVRKSAALCLRRQLPDSYSSIFMQVIEQGVTKREERHLSTMLVPNLRASNFAAKRLRLGVGDAWQELIYALVMMRSGDDSEARARWQAALVGDDENAASYAALIVREGNWIPHRQKLIEAARTSKGTRRTAVIAHLVQWDLDANDVDRILETLELLEEFHDVAHLRYVSMIRDRSNGNIKERAKALISSMQAR